MRSPMLGHSSKLLSRTPRPTHPFETVCISLLDLVVTLAKFLLLFIFSLEETTIQAFLSFMTALAESFPSTSIHNVFSWPILTFLRFSRIRKPILDTIYHRSSLMGVIHSGRVGYISAQTIGAGSGNAILKVSCISDFKVE